ncbi:Hypothetical protein PHPALM_12409 [Phytophthora palmivora]|uniref:Non-structural protein NS-S n=1 Tax=Phytophthora palmivora TaxID=4796 RepID=A0A2P4XZV1_9STRA|nr:Hypothetical protein PHPALM_12409 [Phytophthora palmivora]
MIPTGTKFSPSLIQTLRRRNYLRHCLISLGLSLVTDRSELKFLLKPGDTSILCADLTLKLESRRLQRSFRPLQRLTPLLSLGQVLISILQALTDLQQRLILGLVTLTSSNQFLILIK